MFDLFNRGWWDFDFEKVGYCIETADCVCRTIQVGVANYVAAAIPSQLLVGLLNGKGIYTQFTVDFGGFYGSNGFVIGGLFLFGGQRFCWRVY